MLIQILDHLAGKWNNKNMLTTVIGAYPKPSYLKITDWFNASGGTDTEYPTKFYIDEIKKMGGNVEELFNKATKEIISDQEEDRKSTRLNSSHSQQSRMPSSA